MVSEEVIRRKLTRITTPEHVLEVLQELSARARRRDEHAGELFQAGMKEGYVQAIQLFMDIPHHQAQQLVEDEWL